MLPANNSSYGGFDLQDSMRGANHNHHQHYAKLQGSMVQPTANANFPLTVVSNQNMPMAKSPSDEDEPSFTTEDAHNDPDRGKKSANPSPWQRVKWTDLMVRLLITAVSYITEETTSDYGGRRKCSNLHKKGKWKSVSKVMSERGHLVSPQQCEDKFNDLNKRYKRLNEILGRGTSCEVVENPALLDIVDHVTEKGKEEVKKILSSKHLHYEEMCSYHNGNRLHLPPDPELQRSLRLALRTRDNNDEDGHEADMEDRDEHEENHGRRVKQCQGHEAVTFRNSLDCNKTYGSQPQNLNPADANNQMFSSEGNNADILQKQWMEMDHRSAQLKEKKLKLQAQMLELEKERFNWKRFNQKKDNELEAMKMENERMKLENARLALELKQKEMLVHNL